MRAQIDRVRLYDEASLEKQLRLQQKFAWDLESEIPWDIPIDLNKPLVALDDKAFFFPNSSSEQRLVISQMMGLVITSSVCELEECLLRLRQQCWQDIINKYPVSPEFIELGNQFFDEEEKHALAFRRYLTGFAHTAGIEIDELESILPVIEGSVTEFLVRKNLRAGGHVFWWMTALIEQEFLTLYRVMAPFKEHLEPLFFLLQKKHFEEEARHINFPHLVLELLGGRNQGIRNRMHRKKDLAYAEVLLSGLVLGSLSRVKNVRKLKSKHPIFDVMSSVYSEFEKLPKRKVLSDFYTSVPYVSSLVNPKFHNRFMDFAKDFGALSLPFPNPKPVRMVGL